ncbi:glycosyl hydrolase [Tichowtungia aerotolerans]|uniref:Uncharacterized protein n=1 Tax=Tichowtungia aerotolerans TaxID=2697043 RepID=A0A6P1M7F8_9BACT|nr:glycosyl hydrolase [Tichowtungia aerotolerans]QHI69791.1 hypothetical protein GT409_10130 [Tichowtungia aerotolerans]
MLGRSIALFLLGAALCCSADSVTEARFENPPPEFRPLIIQHSGPIRKANAMPWLRARRGGGYVLDAGGNKTPTGKDVANGETFINLTYLQVPENFQKMEKLIRQLKADGRQAWIYDEYAYPSGSAGGLVMEAHPEHAARVISCRRFKEDEEITLKEGASVFSCVALPEKSKGLDFAAAKDITDEVRPGGFTFSEPGKWTVCLFEISFSDTWKGHNMSRRLLNVLDRNAVDCFIRTTHEKYAQELGPLLGEVDAFFTDEPQFGSAEAWGRTGRKEADQMIQWTDELIPAFEKKNGYPLVSILPALFMDIGEDTAKYRYDFYEVQTDLMAENYFGQIQDWCHAHGTRSSGHMLLEESLLFHVMFSGSAFKNWERQDLPGIDLLGAMPYRSMAFHWEPTEMHFKEDISCKMVSSVAHLMGKPGVFCESFATAEKATLRDVLGSTAWQFSEGVTHHFTYTIQNHFSPEEYAAYSDFAGRLALFARRGKSVSKIAVLAPESSVWAAYAPPGGGGFARYFKDNPEAAKIDDGFRRVCQELLASQQQFECISESLLRTADVRDGGLAVESMEFSTLIVPEMHFAAPGILEKIDEFADAGGRIIFVGTASEVEARMKKQKNISFESSFSSVSLTPDSAVSWNGSDAVRMQVKQDGKETIVILANPSRDAVSGSLKFPMSGKLREWNPESGAFTDTAGDSLGINMDAMTARIITLSPKQDTL